MSDLAIRVENLSKRYRIGGPQERYKTLRDVLTDTFMAPFRRAAAVLRGQPTEGAEEEIWALREVSFEVRKGEVLGIIGRNGAGKSTLLKVLARITEPTAGRVGVKGRVGSLLEVGTGFHPELTGRENVYLNGAILGMKKVEIERKFDEIVSFAEIEKFLDTPVKHYSSGMYMRLAFAVAAHLEPEILVVDEVLAVGDAQFQKKCLGKMGEVAGAGRTVLFVSHNMAAVRQLTKRCMLLSSGVIALLSDTQAAIAAYAEGVSGPGLADCDVRSTRRTFTGLSQRIRFRRVRVVTHSGLLPAQEAIPFIFTVEAVEPVEGFRFSLTVFKADGTPVGSFFTEGDLAVKASVPAAFRVELEDHRLAPGKYYCGVAVGTGSDLTGHLDFDIVSDVMWFEVAAPQGEGGTLAYWVSGWGPIRFRTPRVTPLGPEVQGERE